MGEEDRLHPCSAYAASAGKNVWADFLSLRLLSSCTCSRPYRVSQNVQGRDIRTHLEIVQHAQILWNKSPDTVRSPALSSMHLLIIFRTILSTKISKKLILLQKWDFSTMWKFNFSLVQIFGLFASVNQTKIISNQQIRGKTSKQNNRKKTVG